MDRGRESGPLPGHPHHPAHPLLLPLHLKDRDDGPEQGVKILPVWQRVPIPLRCKFAAEEMHTQDAEDTGAARRGSGPQKPLPLRPSSRWHGCRACPHLKMKMKSMSSMQKVATLSMVFMSTTSWRRSAGIKRTSFSTRSSRKVRSTDSPPSACPTISQMLRPGQQAGRGGERGRRGQREAGTGQRKKRGRGDRDARLLFRHSFTQQILFARSLRLVHPNPGALNLDSTDRPIQEVYSS